MGMNSLIRQHTTYCATCDHCGEDGPEADTLELARMLARELRWEWEPRENLPGEIIICVDCQRKRSDADGPDPDRQRDERREREMD